MPSGKRTYFQVLVIIMVQPKSVCAHIHTHRVETFSCTAFNSNNYGYERSGLVMHGQTHIDYSGFLECVMCWCLYIQSNVQYCGKVVLW